MKKNLKPILDWWARRNFDVDLAAKAYLRKCRKDMRPFVPIQLKYEYWAVYCKQVKQSSIRSDKLYEKYFIRKQRTTGVRIIASQYHLSVIFISSNIGVKFFFTAFLKFFIVLLSGHNNMWLDFSSTCPQHGHLAWFWKFL